MSRMISALDRHGRPRSSSCGRSSIGTSFNLVSTPMETQSMLGRVFTRLTVISEAPRANRKRRWHCSCSCGGTTTAYHWSLLAGRSRSCGCLKSEELNKWQAERLHGKCDTPEYKIWTLMKRRCFDAKYRGYPKYGGRGIIVCDEWRNSFMAFRRDVGPQPSPYHTLERVDEDKAFCPSNCRWLKTRARKARLP